MNEYWKEIDKDLYVISHDYLEDFRAVMGAKTSRSLNLENRISKNTASIASLTKEISEAQSSLNKKMLDVEKNMMDNIKKISKEK